MASIYDNRAVGIDVSHYQATIDWSKCDADFVIIKAGEGKTPDPKVAEHVDGAYRAGKVIGLYWFHDPSIYALGGYPIDKPERWPSPANDPQLQALIKTCSTKAFDFLVLDHERWWLYYSQYFEMLAGKRTNDKVEKVSNAWISTSGKIAAGRISDWLISAYPGDEDRLSRKRFMIYSAKWFLDSYSPDSKAWIDQYDQWAAEYRQPSGSVVIENLAEWREQWLPKISTTGPKWLANKQALIWQVSGDCFKVPWVLGETGQPSAIDINLSMLPKDQFLGLFSPKTPPVPDPEEPDPEDPEAPGMPDLSRVEVALTALQKSTDDILVELRALSAKIERGWSGTVTIEPKQ